MSHFIDCPLYFGIPSVDCAQKDFIQLNYIKFPGVTIDEKLRRKNHIENMLRILQGGSGYNSEYAI